MEDFGMRCDGDMGLWDRIKTWRLPSNRGVAHHASTAWAIEHGLPEAPQEHHASTAFLIAQQGIERPIEGQQ